ncbi:hypothetical protein TrST_g3533 [Triparma strigata]|uniref:Cathepsin propeptide inhibitor domain-containing protein n=1 Tax=Triparma strigata TaxID=1606541 RepID=A0A9W7BKP2_9STRA|nr:hypothetical protein TrST_g3533 [Triparma strigata]
MKFATAAIFATLATATVAHKHPHKKLRKRDAVRSHRQTQDEHEHRFSIFSKNLLDFDELNADLVAKGKDAIHGVTQFTDMERSEFEEQYLGAYYTADDFPNLETITHFPEGRLDSTRGKRSLAEVNAMNGLFNTVSNGVEHGVKRYGYGYGYGYGCTKRS